MVVEPVEPDDLNNKPMAEESRHVVVVEPDPNINRHHRIEAIEAVPVFVREIITGGIAGAAAKTSVAPLERCKILFQTGRLHGASVTTTLVSINRREGIKGLFKGNGASVLRIIPYASIHFGLYEHYRRAFVDAWYGAGYLPENPASSPAAIVSPVVDLLAGSGAGATAVLMTYPLDFVRTRLAYTMETNSNHGGQTIRATLREAMRGEGLVGMYRGIGPSLYGILPYAGLKFYVYQQLKQLHFSRARVHTHANANARLPVPYMLMFGGIAGLVAQTATYPIDVVRRRMQVEGLGKSGGSGNPAAPLLPRTTPKALLHIARREGWSVLWSGLSINYLKVVPSTAIGFTLYDMLKQKLRLPSNL